MFSSATNSLNPFPQQHYFPSSSSANYQHHPPHPPPPPPPITSSLPPIVNQDDDVLFHPQDPLIPSPFLLNIAQIPEAAVANLGASNTGTATMNPNNNKQQQDLTTLYGDHHYHHHLPHHHHHHHHDHHVPNFLANKKPMKKDRHSKIYTAQGLRDRRVRLSIEIAREFFDLQDMLGFDKASKTLEWLLSKSKKAIKDLTRTKLMTSTAAAAKSSSPTTTTSECEEGGEGEEEAGSEVNELVADNANLDEAALALSKKIKPKKLIDESVLMSLRSSAKESRAKARARARERTREKKFMCTKKCPSMATSHHQILNQLRTTTTAINHNHHQHQHEHDHRSPKIVAGIEQENGPLRLATSSSAGAQTPRGNIFQESVFIRRKLLKQQHSSSGTTTTTTYNHQQQQQQQTRTSTTNDEDNNSNNVLICPNWAQNWDMNSALNISTRPSFCAITNMNLSTGYYVFHYAP